MLAVRSLKIGTVAQHRNLLENSRGHEAKHGALASNLFVAVCISKRVRAVFPGIERESLVSCFVLTHTPDTCPIASLDAWIQALSLHAGVEGTTCQEDIDEWGPYTLQGFAHLPINRVRSPVFLLFQSFGSSRRIKSWAPIIAWAESWSIAMIW